MNEHNYFRIEIIKHNQKVEHGAGRYLGAIMSDLKLEATPNHVKTTDQHWFTKEGFEKIGKPCIEFAIREDIQFKLRKVKKLPNRITYRDDLQITIKWKKRYTI